MLKITKNKYEIEETIQITENKEGKEEVLLEIPMQITSDELLKLKEILFGYTNKNISKYQNSTDEEKKQLENNAEKEINNHNEEIADICFKDNKEKIKEIAGEYKYGFRSMSSLMVLKHNLSSKYIIFRFRSMSSLMVLKPL